VYHHFQLSEPPFYPGSRVISKNTGKVILSAFGDGVAYVVFGSCKIQVLTSIEHRIKIGKDIQG
jgi:hypothetical protein